MAARICEPTILRFDDEFDSPLPTGKRTGVSYNATKTLIVSRSSIRSKSVAGRLTAASNSEES